MIATLAIVILVVVAIALFALRMSRGRAVERSIRTYRRRLGTIAEVVEQTTQARSSAPPQPSPLQDAHEVRHVTPEVARLPYLHTDEQVPGELGDRVYVSKEGRLVFGDTAMTPVVPPKAPIYDEMPRRQRSRSRGTHTRVSQPRSVRRPLALCVVLLIIVGAVVGGVLAARPGPTNSALGTQTTIPPAHHAKVKAHHQASSVVVGKLLSSNATSAVFSAPRGTYTVAVDVNGESWFGFQHTEHASGPWLAMATLGGTGPKSYRLSTHGSLVITVGAPSKLTQVLVNGSPLGLPTDRGTSYVVKLVGA